jgi:hypothetical protein
MVKLTYRLHQITTFLLPSFDAIMALWLYGPKAIMASNSHMAVMASKMAIMGVFGNANKNVAFW